MSFISQLRNVFIFLFSKKGLHRCTVCGNSQVTFLPLSEFYLENFHRYGFEHIQNLETLSFNTYTCSECGASDRERLYALWINQQIEKACITTKTRAIHFAPEAGLSEKIKAKNQFIYKTADLFRADVDYKADLMDMPFEDNSFDFFICSHVLEHVESDDRAIKELYRITVPGGCGILMVPIVIGLQSTLDDPNVKDPAERWKHYGQHDHVRLYARKDYVNKIISHGFKVEVLEESYFGKEAFRELGLARTSTLYVVRK